MTYTYENRNGERVEVSSSHLEVAAQIKEELQKSSPNRRCSWVTHKKMMQRQGYKDSDTNENYRCMIKRYQKENGQLPNARKHSDLVASAKLAAIRSAIGEINSAKLDQQEQGRKIRKLLREANRDIVLLESVGEAIQRSHFVLANNRPILPDIMKVDQDNETRMVVCLSDIHYGAHVDIPGNYYDADVAARLLESYADKVVNLIQHNNVVSVDIVNLGDIVEHAYMRNQNLYDSEETLSEQIVNVSRLIIRFIQRIRDVVEIVSYRGISGNHDRMQGDKNSNLNADHAVNISNAIVRMWIEFTESDVDYVDTDGYFTDININGYNFGFVHGDRNNLKSKNVLAQISEQHDRHYDAICGGHIHHYTANEVGYNRYVATFGSIKGADDYSVKIGADASRSQGVILVSDSNFEIRKVNL